MKITQYKKINFFILCRQFIWGGMLFIAVFNTAWADINSPTSTISNGQVFLTQQQRLEAARKQIQPQNKIIFNPIKLPADTKEFPKEQECFQIDKIQLVGDHLESFKWLQKKASQYEHQCIGSKGINKIIHELTKALLERGYVTTRVGIPPQDLKTKTLKLGVTAGLIHQIKTNDQYRYGTIWNAFPTGKNEVLNIRELEQGLEQLQRNPSQKATMEIVPTEKVGESDVVVTRERTKPWRAVFSIDNNGSTATGKTESSGMFAFDNLLGLSDSLNLSLNQDADTNSTRGVTGDSVDYSIPFGYWTFGIAADESKYDQEIEGTYQTFDSSGRTDTQSVRLQRLLHRNQSSKTSAQTKILKRESRSFIDDEEIDVQHQKTTSVELALQHQHYFGAAILDSEVAYRRGVPWFNAQDDWHGSDMPTTRFIIWTTNNTFITPIRLTKNYFLRYRATVRAQYTTDRLFQTEFFSIGNHYTVRGFDGEQTLAAEKGWFIQNDIEFPIFFNQTEQNVYVGIDHGAIGGPSAQYLIGRQLSGAVAGLRGSIKKHISYDVSVGTPIQKPEGFQSRDAVVSFQVSFQF